MGTEHNLERMQQIDLSQIFDISDGFDGSVSPTELSLSPVAEQQGRRFGRLGRMGAMALAPIALVGGLLVISTERGDGDNDSTEEVAAGWKPESGKNAFCSNEETGEWTAVAWATAHPERADKRIDIVPGSARTEPQETPDVVDGEFKVQVSAVFDREVEEATLYFSVDYPGSPYETPSSHDDVEKTLENPGGCKKTTTTTSSSTTTSVPSSSSSSSSSTTSTTSSTTSSTSTTTPTTIPGVTTTAPPATTILTTTTTEAPPERSTTTSSLPDRTTTTVRPPISVGPAV